MKSEEFAAAQTTVHKRSSGSKSVTLYSSLLINDYYALFEVTSASYFSTAPMNSSPTGTLLRTQNSS